MSLFTLLLILWGAVTLTFLVVMAWKSIVGMREEDVIILHTAESRQATEQQQMIDRMVRLTRWAKTFGFAALALGVAVGGIYAWQGYQAFSGQTP